ncbi:hypothetical protein ACLM5J_19635 [Nocardioides sp. Bht2]|uniref:hypothetical protein n=1 Tax=Nocardioides sp. Bht2 TaxID=3392297 RepID=UPI0039B489F7
MALTPGMRRRPEGSLHETVLFQTRVASETKSSINDIAGACGISTAWFLDLLAEHLTTDLDEHGRPRWFKEPAILTDHPELPLPQSA